ncbi:MAG: sugar transferase [Dehalococcoidia bacterium]|nr:sugar transferase [Dehalococcoidia bacterium]
MAMLKSKRGVRRLFTYSLWKGVVDRLLALLGIVVLSPLLILIAMGIRLDSPGNPIFSQERVGRGDRRFVVHKFRTMHVNNDDSEYKEYLRRLVTQGAPYGVDRQRRPVYKVADDPRVTRMGALLRKTNLDELPQFFNVLKGEMSFVGPRPDIPFSVELYEDWHRKRLSVKPGITGMWQVCERANLSFDDMVRLDIEYVERQSPLLDSKIMLLTVDTILRRDGSYRDGKEMRDG